MIYFHFKANAILGQNLLCISCYFVGLFSVVLSINMRQYGESCDILAPGRTLFCDHDSNIFCHYECECSVSSYLRYTLKAQPICIDYVTDWGYHLKYDKCRASCPYDQFCTKKGHCQCRDEDEGEVLVDGKCYQAVYGGPMDRCNISSGRAFLCDPKLLSYCSDEGVCTCFVEYAVNTETRRCVLRRPDDFVSGGYRYRPSEFCFVDSDCLDGLVCLNNNTCDCPSYCPYRLSEGVCDCGAVEYSTYSTPKGVIWCGVILGIISVCFWCCLISRLRRKHSWQSPAEQDDPAQENESAWDPETVPLQEEKMPCPTDDDQPPPYSAVVTNPPFLINPDSAGTFPPPYSQASNPNLPYPRTSDPSLPYPQMSDPSSAYPQTSNSNLPCSLNPTQVGFSVPWSPPVEPSAPSLPPASNFAGSDYKTQPSSTPCKSNRA